MQMIVLITGSREWHTDEHIITIARELSALPRDTRLIHGAARGVDTIAAAIGELLEFDVIGYPAEWDNYPRHQAGPIRNRKMLFEEKPNLVLAFHHDIEGKSSGTKDMIAIAKVAGVQTRIVTC